MGYRDLFCLGALRGAGLAAMAALVFAGCGGGGSSTPAPTATTTISGTAMAGLFLGGQACAYQISGGAKGALLGSCANLASSAFSIDIGSYTGDVLIEIAAGATYDDEANPADNVTGTVLTGSLRTLVNVGTAGGSVALAVTPLSEIAVRLAGSTLDNTTVQAAVAQIAGLLPVVSGLDLRTTLPDANTNLGLAYREVLRALSQMQWVAGGNAAYSGGLDAYLTFLLAGIGSNASGVAGDLLTQLNIGLNNNCAVSGGTLSCSISSGGGGGGSGSQMGGSIQGNTLSLSTAVSTLAGTNTGGAVDGTGTAARFNYPAGLTSDGSNLYVADKFNHTIRKVVIATGVVSTLAGTAGNQGSANGTGAAASFNNPNGIATDGTSLFVVDELGCLVRKIDIATAAVSTLAGGPCGYGDGTGTAARFNMPTGITTDNTNVYVADTNTSTIRKIVIATGEVTTLAGTQYLTGTTDASGSAARFNYPTGLTTDGTNLYVADNANHSIRKIVIATGEVTTLAGTSGTFGSTDGAGSAALFKNPYAISSDGSNLYVTDSNNYTVRKIEISSGATTTVAGSAGSFNYVDDTGSAARFNILNGITTDGNDLFVTGTAGYVRRIQ